MELTAENGRNGEGHGGPAEACSALIYPTSGMVRKVRTTGVYIQLLKRDRLPASHIQIIMPERGRGGEEENDTTALLDGPLSGMEKRVGTMAYA